MKAKDIVTAVGIGLTFVASVWNLLYTFSATKTTRYIDIVTSARIEWIQSVRENMSRFAGLARHWSITPIADADISIRSITKIHQHVRNRHISALRYFRHEP